MFALLRSYLLRLRAFFIGRRLDQEFDQEVEQHIALLTEENIRRGMNAEEARYAALREFGGLTQVKEINRQRRGLHHLEVFMQDIRYAWRMMCKSPGFTLVAVLTLALGIGANTAMFSVVNAVIWNSIPYRAPDRIAYFEIGDPAHGGFDDHVSIADFVDWQKQNHVFDQMAAFQGKGFVVSGADMEPEHVMGNLITANWLPVLGMNVQLGRNFSPEEEQPGQDDVVILSQVYWKRVFNSDPKALGQKIELNGRPYTIVGILPPDLRFWDRDIYVPFAWTQYTADRKPLGMAHALARLNPRVSMSQAQSEMAGIAHQLELQFPATNQYRSVRLKTLLQNESELAPTPRRMHETLLVMLGAVGLITLMACANVASLLLARGLKRQKEFVMRIALGSSRTRVARQLLTESVMLFLLGGAAGLLLATLSRDLMIRTTASYLNDKPVELNVYVFLFSLTVSLVTGLLFGLGPAQQAVKVNLNDAMKDTAQSSSGLRRNRLRSSLIVAEIALATVMLVGFGLLTRSFINVMNAPQGFETANIVTVATSLDGEKYKSGSQQLAFSRKALDQAATIPGVRSAGLASRLPLGGGGTDPFFVQGREGAGQIESQVRMLEVSPRYFDTFHIPLRQGRQFNESDNESAPTVAIVNETLAREFFPGESPLGRRVKVESPQNPWCEIVGVIGDAHQRNMDEDEMALVYRPWSQVPGADIGIALQTRSQADVAAVGNTLRARLRALDPALAWEKIQTMQQVIDDSESVKLRRPIISLLGAFGTIAVLLAVIGIYGVLSYSVAERTREIGIRMALGALPSNVMRSVLRETTVLLAGGLALGVAIALALTRLLPTGNIGWSGAAIHLYGVTRTDFVTYGGVAFLLTLVALMASFIPARRATKVDPMVALRYE